MHHALRLARRGLGNVWPNPAVGCLIVRDGNIVGRGWTQPFGRPHAEQIALNQAAESARGATAYVTLEPCAHHGKTPPCANALIAAGVRRVVSAQTDPDQRVAGKGYAILRAAGVEVTENVCMYAANLLQAGFLSRINFGRPFLTLKLANSFDGRIATANRESKWITGPEARMHVHLMRSMHDAIMVGGGTARDDKPALNVRGLAVPRQPMRVVLSSRPITSLPPEGPEHGPLLQLSGDLAQVMHDLAGQGITRVFCEGGSTVAANLLRAGLVDQLIGYTAGMVLGAEALAAVGALDIRALNEAARFRLVETYPIGNDVFHRWTRR